MKALELLNELGNSTVEFDVTHCDDEYCEIIAESIGLVVYLTRGLSSRIENENVFIEFAVHGMYNITGTGNSIKVFSTVKQILESTLNKFIKKSDNFVEFGAEKQEPSRIKLYDRLAPIVGNILGNNWKYVSDNSYGNSLKVYRWERQSTKLNEKSVQSTWISDLTYNRPNRLLVMRLSNGRSFAIENVSRALFDRWNRTPSKGSFFHTNIKDRYKIVRIK